MKKSPSFCQCLAVLSSYLFYPQLFGGTFQVPEEPYTGPMTNVSGQVGASSERLLSYGIYPNGGSSWRFLAKFTETSLAAFIAAYGNTWRNENFDDASWSSGLSQIGYGDAPRDEVTLLAQPDYSALANVQSPPVALFRTKFTISDIATLNSVTGSVKFDDSCAVFVNGSLIYRHGDLTSNAPLTEYTETTTAPTRENAEANLNVPLSVLHDGINTIAVEIHQHDAGSSDLSFDLQLSAHRAGNDEVRWTLQGSPYRLTNDVTVPSDRTLVIEPGVRVFADPSRRLIVNGILKVLGTPEAPVNFTHVPGAPLVDDPREPGTQSVPPKWGGILFSDTLSDQNIVQNANFYGAQPTAVEGSITVVRSTCLISFCTFCATYLHGIYGKNCSLTVQDCTFPSVFPPGKEALGETLDNLSEFIEVDSPATDPGIAGKPEFANGFPVGGHLRLYRNKFYGSSGHNDLVDITSGKWGVSPVLDVQENHFYGPTGDEHIDLNGDAYIAGNYFENCSKDNYTSDQGYANAISSDVGATDTTVVVVRNIFSHCDHAVNVKRGSAVIFEHNTVADINADYSFTRGSFSQTVKGSAINFFIPEDSGAAGDGAYVAYNLFYGQSGNGPLSRILSWTDEDLPTRPQKTTKLEMAHNFIDPAIVDPFIGAQHPQNVLDASWHPTLGDPQFFNRETRDYSIPPTSPAHQATPHGWDFGGKVPPGCFLLNPPRPVTPNTSESVTIGGPGIFAYKWRLDNSDWSEPVPIGSGIFPRTSPTSRTASHLLSDLPPGVHHFDVIGQDFAGNWINSPTSIAWTISSSEPSDYASWLSWHNEMAGQDTDGDGLDTLSEYAFGTSPKHASPSPISFSRIDSAWVATISLPIDASSLLGHGRLQLRYQFETSDTLKSEHWEILASKQPQTPWQGSLVSIGSPGENFMTVSIGIPQSSSINRSYFRVRAFVLP